MNKYLRYFLDAIIKLSVAFVGFLLSLNILALGYVAFPELVIRVDEIFRSNPSGSLISGFLPLVPGSLPVFVLVAAILLSVLSFYITIQFSYFL